MEVNGIPYRHRPQILLNKSSITDYGILTNIGHTVSGFSMLCDTVDWATKEQ